MKNQNRISNRAGAFLRAMRGAPDTLPGIIARQQIHTDTLARWFRSPVFRQTQRSIIREVRRLSDVELELAARAATRIFSEALTGLTQHDQETLLVCAVLIQAQQELRRAESRARSQPVRRAGRPGRHAGPRLHPSHSPEEARRMLKRMYAWHLADVQSGGKAADEARAASC